MYKIVKMNNKLGRSSADMKKKKSVKNLMKNKKI